MDMKKNCPQHWNKVERLLATKKGEVGVGIGESGEGGGED
jgi:hypothetical protein